MRTRVLLRFERSEDDFAFFLIPSWKNDEDVAVHLSKIPVRFHRLLSPNCYLLAHVELSAASSNELFISDFEASPQIEEDSIIRIV